MFKLMASTATAATPAGSAALPGDLTEPVLARPTMGRRRLLARLRRLEHGPVLVVAVVIAVVVVPWRRERR